MSRSEELADQLVAAGDAFVDYVAGLTPEEWQTVAVNHPDVAVGADERRPVGVVAHHVGDMLPMLAEIVRRRAAGEETVRLTPADIDAINARHAAGNERPDQAETVAMIRDNAIRAADLVRGLTDEQLDRAGPEELPAEQVVRRIMIGHFGWHEASIRATVRR
ncbi:MAG TPA: DinB family protein [Candidatus Eisenbacteria bacterium]|nr:DinB family protein [Candidatus Eisenbacteria bacterium]